MAIIGAFILPHGSMILDPNKKNIPKEAIKLHKAMIEIKKSISELKPELIFFTSPHSIALSNDFGIYLNKGGSGSAEWNDEYQEFTVEIEINQEISQNLLEYLDDKETAIQGIAAFTPGVNAPFRWGEVVPLWFLKDINPKPKFIILSQPLRRLDKTKDLIPETITLGNDLRLFFESLDKRVLIIISADLGHTHQEDGPYGFSEDAETFDLLMEEWAASLDSNLLVKKAVPMLNTALCCGYIGFVLLQNMIENKGFITNVITRSNPTYYGMLIASYIDNSKLLT